VAGGFYECVRFFSSDDGIEWLICSRWVEKVRDRISIVCIAAIFPGEKVQSCEADQKPTRNRVQCFANGERLISVQLSQHNRRSNASLRPDPVYVQGQVSQGR
jgi:hypothetical protein